jgi:uncharacterized protein (DUF2225 family)
MCEIDCPKKHYFKVRDKVISVLFGTKIQCQKCGEFFIYSRVKMNNLHSIENFALLSSIIGWILYENILPYILWVVFYVICGCFAYKFVPIVPLWKSVCCDHVFIKKEQFFSIFSGTAFQCQKCGGFFVYSREWISVITIVEVLAFFVTVVLSALYRSFFPYILYVAFCALCSYLSYRFVPIRSIE